MPSKAKKEVTDAKRLRQILDILFKYEFGYLIDKIKLRHALHPGKKAMKHKFKEKESNPEKLRYAFEDLGATFIKLGQLLSLRPDLIPKEYSEEFSKLQDEVKPFPFIQVKEIIENEFGKPIEKVFAGFNKKPIAAASVGQVHEAKLKKGERVAVKVKRPGIKDLFQSDIHLLYYLAKLIKKHHPSKIVDPVEIVKEFEKYTIREMDYLREAKNIKKFYELFKQNKTTKIPKIYWEYTTNNIITTELIQGIKISDVKKLDKFGYNRKKIVKNLANSILKQVFIDGFFHADPHPANVFVLKDNKIALLDFGITGYLGEGLRDNSADLFIAALKGDVDMIVECLLSLGFVDGPIDIESLKESLVDHLSEYRDTSLRYVELSAVFHNIISIAQENNIRLPVNFILLGKAIVTVESTCYMLDPDFNLLREAQPFVKKLEKIRMSPKLFIKRTLSYSQRFKKFFSKLPEQSEQFLIEIRDADKTIRSIDKDLQGLNYELSKVGSHFVFGIIVVGLIIGGAMLMKFDDVKIWGVPKYSFMYLSLAVVLILFLLISNLSRKNR